MRLLLAAAFTVAGVAKLSDRSGTSKALRDFQVPVTWVPALAFLLPFVEIATALALIPASSARYAALVALGLLVALSATIGVNLLRGNTPDCHCFGQIYSGPVGWRTLARNGALAAAAAFITFLGWSDPGPSVTGWLGQPTLVPSAAALGGGVILAFIVAQSWLLVQVLRQNGRLLARLDALEAGRAAGAPSAILFSQGPMAGLAVGARAPTFALADLNGETHTLDALTSLGKPILLVFAETECHACNELLPEIDRWQQQHAKKFVIALIVSRGTRLANRERDAYHALDRVLLQQEREVTEAYEAYGTPSAVVVRPDGAIGSPLAQGAAAIRALVARTAEAPALLQMQSILTTQAARADATGQASGIAGSPLNEVDATASGARRRS